MILCFVCVIPQTESKSGRSGRRHGSGSRSSGLPARVSELEELFQNQSSWLQALQDQTEGLPTLQDYLTLNQTLFDQACAIQELQDRLDNLESCTCGRPGTPMGVFYWVFRVSRLLLRGIFSTENFRKSASR